MDAHIIEIVLAAHLATMRQRLDQAASIAKAAEALAGTGNIEKAVEIALDVEPLISDVNNILNAASLMNKLSSK